MKIYTKTGDNGETSLCGGTRTQKNSLRVSAYGEIDELNSHIGLILSIDEDKKFDEILMQIQKDLFVVGAYIASPETKAQDSLPKFDNKKIENLENIIDKISATLPEIKRFILPGGSRLAAELHIARTVCRRAERTCTALKEEEDLFVNVLPYLNRLSDLLFVLARHANNGTDTFA
ncbi:cob(I)yrinic acid a,c-diamide adenosyltransferase [Patescibacteria group bacterium]|nr:cob(I)yrinic acid a,c-diamide adenosyltransferase [Patescibacteria group bacterium]